MPGVVCPLRFHSPFNQLYTMKKGPVLKLVYEVTKTVREQQRNRSNFTYIRSKPTLITDY